jgi:hypothetical protein
MDKGSKMKCPLNLKQKALLSFETLKNSNPARTVSHARRHGPSNIKEIQKKQRQRNGIANNG